MRLTEVRDRVLDMILDEQRSKYNNKLEPFETYAARMKKECQERLEQYLECLNSGYESILKKISTQLK